MISPLFIFSTISIKLKYIVIIRSCFIPHTFQVRHQITGQLHIHPLSITSNWSPSASISTQPSGAGTSGAPQLSWLRTNARMLSTHGRKWAKLPDWEAILNVGRIRAYNVKDCKLVQIQKIDWIKVTKNLFLTILRNAIN